MNLLELPNIMLIEIFEYLPYEEISKKRLVCRRIEDICQHILNCGFNKAVRQHSISFKRIKALLPRRESERRNHSLARHADILTSIETRISMLSMTYSKYMDLSLCCFIPGRVLDEIFRILLLIKKSSKPLRPHEVLQELRDLSSMAIEHFDEKIACTLKKSFVDNNNKVCNNNAENPNRTTSSSSVIVGLALNASSSSNCFTAVSNMSMGPPCFKQTVNNLLSQTLDAFKKTTVGQISSTVENNAKTSSCNEPLGCPEARTIMVYFKKLESDYKKEIVKIHRMQQLQTLQTRRLQQATKSIADLNMQIKELKKRLEDVDAKNREISANIKQINTGEPTTSSSGTEVVTDGSSLSVIPTAASTSIDNQTATKRHYKDLNSEATVCFSQKKLKK